MALGVALFLLCLDLWLAESGAGPVPEQVHIALGEKPNSITIQWVTFAQAPQELYFGRSPSNMTKHRTAETKLWNFRGVSRYMHRVKIFDLHHEIVYYYKVGSNYAYSKTFHFKTFPEGSNFPYKIGILGDLGSRNGKALPFVIEAVQKGWIDMVIHIGDIAYNMQTNNGRTGDEYMRMIEPAAAYVPYMVIAGNHEDDGDKFANLRWRFDMPYDPEGDNQYYSFDLGPVHWTALSSEYYGFVNQFGSQKVHRQYSWLQNDLQKAYYNRGQRPWIITYQHRPIYCSNEPSNQCHSKVSMTLRYGGDGLPGLEPLFAQYGVDINFSGHMHSYERYYPRSNSYNAVAQNPYHNARAPTYVITGSAGSPWDPASKFAKNPSHLSVVRSSDYSYTVMHVHNRTHVFFKQISVSGRPFEIDKVWLTKG